MATEQEKKEAIKTLAESAVDILKTKSNLIGKSPLSLIHDLMEGRVGLFEHMENVINTMRKVVEAKKTLGKPYEDIEVGITMLQDLVDANPKKMFEKLDLGNKSDEEKLKLKMAAKNLMTSLTDKNHLIQDKMSSQDIDQILNPKSKTTQENVKHLISITEEIIYSKKILGRDITKDVEFLNSQKEYYGFLTT